MEDISFDVSSRGIRESCIVTNFNNIIMDIIDS